MKKYISYIAALLYLVFSTGVLVNAHYCDNDLTAVNYFDYEQQKTCGCDNEDDACCKDEHHFFKVTDHKIAVSELSLVSFSFICDLPSAFSSTSTLTRSISKSVDITEAPDIVRHTALFILNRVLRL